MTTTIFTPCSASISFYYMVFLRMCARIYFYCANFLSIASYINLIHTLVRFSPLVIFLTLHTYKLYQVFRFNLSRLIPVIGLLIRLICTMVSIPKILKELTFWRFLVGTQSCFFGNYHPKKKTEKIYNFQLKTFNLIFCHIVNENQLLQ